MTYDRPTLVNPITLTDTVATSANWPCNLSSDSSAASTALDNTKDYILDLPYYRTRALDIVGGRNIWVIGGHLTRSDNDNGPSIRLAGGAAGRTVWFEGLLIDGSGGKETDGLRTLQRHISPDTTIAKFKNCRVVGLRGQDEGPTDDFGNSSGGTHADVIQTDGGLGGLWMQDCTLSSRYAGLQLQAEVKTADGGLGASRTITAISGSGAGGTRTYTVGSSHGIVTDDWVQITGCSPSDLNGTLKCESTAATTITLRLGSQMNPGAASGFGTANKVTQTRFVGEYVTEGGLNFERVNMYGLVNRQQYITGKPDETLMAFRIGCRPSNKTNEDKTPFASGGWNGTASFTNFYCALPPNTTDIDNFVEPDGNASTHSVHRAVQAGSAGSRTLTYPNWSDVTGTINEGVPAGGDYCPSWLPGINYPAVRAP